VRNFAQGLWIRDCARREAAGRVPRAGALQLNRATAARRSAPPSFLGPLLP